MNKIDYYPINIVRSDSKKLYIEEGYGGKHIKYFPPSYFFKVFLDNEKRAIDLFFQWYNYMFLKYFDKSKKIGGMENGSLYKLIQKEHQKKSIKLKKDLSNIDKFIYNNSIKKRVIQRFNLLESIRDKGYRPGKNFIEGIFKDKFIYLNGGHHRCAALYVLENTRIQIKIKV